MARKSFVVGALIICGALSIFSAVGLVAYHRSVGFKGATLWEELGFFIGAGLAVAGIGIAVWRQGR